MDTTGSWMQRFVTDCNCRRLLSSLRMSAEHFSNSINAFLLVYFPLCDWQFYKHISGLLRSSTHEEMELRSSTPAGGNSGYHYM